MENQLETTVTCKICGAVKKQISFKHLQSHNMTVKEYREKFPNAVLQSLDMIRRATKNGGQHMKTEKYKKMFSEMYKGEKNWNHKNNTTELQRQSLSPFSIEFYRKKYPTSSDEELQNMVSEFAKKAIVDRISPLQLEYYTNKGMSIDDAKTALKKRQTTFSLEKCIEKYGENEGRKRWLDRQEKWHKNYKKTNFSKISQICFHQLFSEIKKTQHDLEIYFATYDYINDTINDVNDKNRNFEYSLRLQNISIKPDFFIKNKNKIVEFDGVYYHRETPENIKRTELRNNEIIISGYSVYHINELAYNRNPVEEIEKCLAWVLG